MEITEVKISPVNEEHLKAYVTIILDQCFLIRDIKVIRGNSGLFVAMPSKKRKDGSFKDVAHPINSETRQQFESVILGAYHEELEKQDEPDSGEEQPAPSYGEQDEQPPDLSYNKESEST